MGTRFSKKVKFEPINKSNEMLGFLINQMNDNSERKQKQQVDKIEVEKKEVDQMNLMMRQEMQMKQKDRLRKRLDFL